MAKKQSSRLLVAKEPTPGTRLFYSPALNGYVFKDDRAPETYHVVRIESLAGTPYVIANSYAVERSDTADTLIIRDTPTELFRVNSANGFVVPKPAGVATGILNELSEVGFLGNGRLVDKWQAYLVGG